MKEHSKGGMEDQVYTTKQINIKHLAQETFKMVEEQDVEITFFPTNTSEIHLHVEQLLQNTYWMLAEDLRLPKRQETPHVPG